MQQPIRPVLLWQHQWFVYLFSCLLETHISFLGCWCCSSNSTIFCHIQSLDHHQWMSIFHWNWLLVCHNLQSIIESSRCDYQSFGDSFGRANVSILFLWIHSLANNQFGFDTRCISGERESNPHLRFSFHFFNF